MKECSTLLSVPENVLYHEISKIKTKEFEARINKKPEEEKKEEIISEKKSSDSISVTKYEKEEQNIIRVLIKFGENILFKDENGNSLSVSQYIFEELENDKIEFQKEIHRKIIDEYKNHFKDEGFSAEKYFLNHPEYEISALTADLISDKYILSKIHSKFHKIETELDRINELAPRFIYEYKLAMILQKRKDKMIERKSIAEKSDSTAILELMKEIKQIDFFKSKLSEELDRVLNML